MRKGTKLAFCLSFAGFASFFLFGCNSATSSSSVSHQVAYTVIYYDDAPTKNRIGYSYVLPGQSATYPSHFYGDVTYDYLSRSDQSFSEVGNYFAFKDFEGTYPSSDEAIDLSHVTSDCEVHAVFEEKAYQITYKFYNNGSLIRDASGDAVTSLLSFGAAPELPALSSSDDTGAKWYQSASFEGYRLADDSAADPAIFSKAADFSFVSGSGSPSASATKGAFYADTSRSGGVCTYPVYSFDGSSWTKLGVMQDGLVIKLDAVFDYSFKAFPVSIYDYVNGDPSSTENPILKHSLDVTYLDGISYSINGMTTTFAYGAVTFDVTTAKTPTSWRGVYRTSDDYNNQSVDLTKIMQKCSLYPVY